MGWGQRSTGNHFNDSRECQKNAFAVKTTRRGAYSPIEKGLQGLFGGRSNLKRFGKRDLSLTRGKILT